MKKIVSFFALGLLLSVALTSCSSKGSEVLNHIPKEALFVTQFNIKNLMDKGEYAKIWDMEMGKDFLDNVKQEDESLVEVVKNPEKSGLNVNGIAAMYVAANPSSVESFSGAGIFPVADKTKLLAILNKNKALKWEKGNGYEYVSIQSDIHLAVSDKMLIFWAQKEFKLEALNAVVSGFNSNSIAKNSAATKALDPKNDVAMYLSTDGIADELYKMNEVKTGLAGIGFADENIFKGNQMTIALNFEKGKAVSSANYVANPKLGALVAGLFNDKVKTDFRKYLSKDKNVFATTFSLSPTGLKDLFSRGVLAMGSASALGEINSNWDEIIASTQGDMAVSLNTISSQPGVTILLKLNKPDFINKLMAFAVKSGVIAIKDGYWTMGGQEDNPSAFSATILDNTLVFCNNSATFNQLRGGGIANDQQISAEDYAAITKDVLGFISNDASYMDLYASLGIYGSSNSADEMAKILDKYAGKSIATMGRNQSTAQTNLKDQSKNYLKSWLEMLNELYVHNKKNKPTEDSDISTPGADSNLEELMIEEEASKGTSL